MLSWIPVRGYLSVVICFVNWVADEDGDRTPISLPVVRHIWGTFRGRRQEAQNPTTLIFVQDQCKNNVERNVFYRRTASRRDVKPGRKTIPCGMRFVAKLNILHHPLFTLNRSTGLHIPQDAV